MTLIAQILTRADNTLFGDTAGALALAAFTYGLLHLPGLI